METTATLPDDILREIFVRVSDATTLFRCAATCKRWRVLVADSSFLRRRWPVDAPYSSSHAGFLTPQDYRGKGKPVFVPVPRSPISPIRRSLSSFFGDVAGLLDSAVPLTSRRSLLLVQIPEHVSGEPLQLAVCNILAGTCDLLPPLQCDDVDFSIKGYTILTTDDFRSHKHRSPSPGYSSFFKVLLIIDGARYQYHLFRFSSDESSWTKPRQCIINNSDYITHAFSRCGGAVVCRGTSHWLFKGTSNYYTLDVRADTGHVSLTKLLVRSSLFGPFALKLIITMDGALSLLRMRSEANHIDIWTRQEKESGDGVAEWLCTRTIELNRPKSLLDCVFLICVGERSDTLLFMDPYAHVADLKNGTTEEDVGEQFKGLICEESRSLMVDWPSLFMSRLGNSGKVHVE